MKCRHCKKEIEICFLDLGSAPYSNAYLTFENINSKEIWFPLKVMVCSNCWLVQTEDYSDSSELFSPDYAYFSSYSSTWLDHANKYVNEMIARFNLGVNSHIVEIEECPIMIFPDMRWWI